MIEKINIQDLIDISKEAGDAIMKIYKEDDFHSTIDFKADDSPLTIADKAANKVIVTKLRALYPEIDLLSEEEKEVPFSTRKDWKTFWCIDPLDGTKEFIKRNGQFTVNIALIHNHYPVLGIVYAPVLDIYYVSDGKSSFKIEKGVKSALVVNNKKENRIAVRSASHAAPEEDTLLAKYGVTDAISVGSSLKFCMVADGKADIYYRHGPTMEWDTAAGQAVLEGAKGKVEKLNGERFSYNKEKLLNSSFVCFGF